MSKIDKLEFTTNCELNSLRTRDKINEIIDHLNRDNAPKWKAGKTKEAAVACLAEIKSVMERFQ